MVFFLPRDVFGNLNIWDIWRLHFEFILSRRFNSELADTESVVVYLSAQMWISRDKFVVCRVRDRTV